MIKRDGGVETDPDGKGPPSLSFLRMNKLVGMYVNV